MSDRSPPSLPHRQLAELGGELRDIRGRLDRFQARLDALCGTAAAGDSVCGAPHIASTAVEASREAAAAGAASSPATLAFPGGLPDEAALNLRIDPTEALHVRLRSARLHRPVREGPRRLHWMARAAGLLGLLGLLVVALAPLLFRTALERRGVHAHRVAWIGIADLFVMAAAARLFGSRRAARLTTLVALLVSVQWLALGWLAEPVASGSPLDPRFATGAALALVCWLGARLAGPLLASDGARSVLPLLGHAALLVSTTFQLDGAKLIAFWAMDAWVVALISARTNSSALRVLSVATWMMPLIAWLRMSVPWLAGGVSNSSPFFDIRFMAAVPIMFFGLWSARLIRRRDLQRRRTEPPLAALLALTVNALFLVGFVLQWHHVPEQIRGELPPVLRHSTVGLVWTLDLAIAWWLAFRWGVFTARLGAWLLSVVAVAGHVAGGGLHWPRSLAEFVPFANERFLGMAALAAVYFLAAWFYSHTKAQMAAGAPGYRRQRALWWGEAWAGIAAGLIGHALLLSCIVLDVRAWLAQARALEVESLAGAVAARQFIYSGVAAVYFAIVALIGLATHRRPLKVLALAGFAGVAVKTFFGDLAGVPLPYRIGGIAAVGVLLLVVRRFRRARRVAPSIPVDRPHVALKRAERRAAGAPPRPHGGRKPDAGTRNADPNVRKPPAGRGE